MSRHICETSTRKWVFGWDQALMGFFLQVHDKTLPQETDPIIHWLGGADSRMYEVEDLARIAKKHGLDINIETQAELFVDKDEGR